MNIVEEKYCRVCKGELKDVLDLGEIYPSAFLKDDEKLSEDGKAPLCLVECKECGLVQLKHTIDLDLMYRQYWYASSLNKSMVSSLQDIVDDIKSREILEPADDIIDIGCNDGTMLAMYDNGKHLYFKTGFDPAFNLKRDSKVINFFINDYFNAQAFYEERGSPNGYIKAKVITAIAMFYDLPDPNKFVEEVKELLHPKGIFVIQFTDLLSMIKATAFDNICHEHLEYYRLVDVVNLLREHGLQVIDVSYNDVNGGSLRVIACHDGAYTVCSRVEQALVDESNFLSTYGMDYFKKNIELTKFKVKEFLKWGKEHGHRIYLMGASTKGNTLLQVCGATGDLVPYAAEVNKDKFGLRTAGSDIKIVSEEEALIKHPDYFLVPVWHFKESLLRNPRIVDYINSGGHLVFPLPEFHVVFSKYGDEIGEVRI